MQGVTFLQNSPTTHTTAHTPVSIMYNILWMVWLKAAWEGFEKRREGRKKEEAGVEMEKRAAENMSQQLCCCWLSSRVMV